MVRKPAVAGTFYAGTGDALREQIRRCFLHPLGPGKIPFYLEEGKDKRKVAGLVSPHAGYVYSGPVAAWGFARVVEKEKPQTVIILGPNHRGFGSPVAIMVEGEWETPLGRVSIDTQISNKILQAASGVIEEDEKAHQREHSLEVQVPFLQYFFDDFKIVPICFADQTLRTCLVVGNAIYQVIKERAGILVIASTDLTHYQSQSIAEKEDKKIIDAIISGDPQNLAKVLSSGDFSMCGYGPVFALLQAFSHLSEKKITLLKYATSGDISGDYSAVVGYASLSVEI